MYTMESTVPFLSEDQNTIINRLLDGYSDVPSRLLRDSIIHAIHPSIDTPDNSYSEFFYTVHDGTEYYDSIVNIVDDTVSAHVDSTLIVDLMNPNRIPKGYSIDGRRRMQDIMSVMYNIDVEDTSTMSPYEIMLTLDILSTDSGSANVYVGKYMDAYSMIVKTVNKKETDIRQLLHEYLVGHHVNRLRSDIPNFMYTYGVTRGMILNNVGEKAYYTARSLNEYTLAVEYISNAIPLYSMMTLIDSSDQIRLILLQILCALTYAYYRIGFIHRDLNTGNILLVRLPEVTAIPIMVPVSGDIQFERRYILTDILVMIIDYGHSSIIPTYTKSDSILVSPESHYIDYETVTKYENDIVILILGLGDILLDEYPRDDPIYHDFIYILYRLYTGDSLDESLVNSEDFHQYHNYNRTMFGTIEFNLYKTSPYIKYDPYGTIADYCSRYSHLFRIDTGDYTNILQNEVDVSPQTITVSDTRSYYWYLRYGISMNPDIVTLDMNNILSNVWYRRDVLRHIMYATTGPNERVIDAIFRYVDNPNVAVLLIVMVYKYILYYEDLQLDIHPFAYEYPSDILDTLTEYIESRPRVRRSINRTIKQYIRTLI